VADRSQLSTEYAAPESTFQERLAEVWQDVLDIDRVGIHDNFFELGGDSLLGAVLINALQKELGIQLYVVSLFDAPTVAELEVYLERHFPAAVAAIYGKPPAIEARQVSFTSDTGIVSSTVTSADFENFRSMASTWHKVDSDTISQWKSPRNPRMVYILTTPRSGSSLLRIMLAGHPRLFAPPELELLSFDTLQQRREHLTDRLGFMREGLVRAVMQIRNCNADDAQAIIVEHEASDDSSQIFYGYLQKWIGKQILVDKSASYALSKDILNHAEEGFSDNLYIHLVRNPYATVHSFEEARLDRILNFHGEHDYNVRQLAELTWSVSHQNILDFLKNVPEQRQLRIHFEDLVQNPRPVIEMICQHLGVEYDPLMLQPYQQKDKRMTDGVSAQSVGMTDTKFHQHKEIDPSVAESWRGIYKEDFLSDVTWDIASQIGYDQNADGVVSAKQDASLEIPVPALVKVPRDIEHPPLQSYSQQRLWFIDQLSPGGHAYNTSRIIQLDGELDIPALEYSLNEILRRHEVCRTSYGLKDGQPVQVIHAAQTLDLQQLDLTSLSDKERSVEQDKAIRDELLCSFDLATGSLLRALLIHTGIRQHILILGIHHILTDAWSRGVLHRELSELYRARIE
jgi:acyl carrier protein/LPS sulfotransferase NodH